ncbi:hypothetical protein TSOC_008098 [Tetrabaena socialis]|uniref:Uncharacterized protein n=1 Tax=Tetrabaena socialis TaxID=47790 RepID=A0A2J7ZZB4_9CHLO|nr:hypothetical protein TSOC_008098 [Tetrabaena socialis]|eukprot:PNH05611.1 hypothetical protein TSOC_008098 [Tetrabaena socialis]
MVRTWNREPSPDQPRGQSPRRRSRAFRFIASTPRFAFDGAPRMPNFLNGQDDQLTEKRGHMSLANTSTHTRYDFSGMGSTAAGLSLAADVARSINACSALRSATHKVATARSLVCADTRYDLLAEPHADHVGPGTYDTTRGAPDLGVLPRDSHTSSAVPHRDPYRASPPFLAPERPSSVQQQHGANVVYISPTYVPGSDNSVPWTLTTDHRTDAAEWRYGHSRVQAVVSASQRARLLAEGDPRLAPGGTGSSVPPADAFSSDLSTDVAGRQLDLSLRAATRNTNGISFSTTEELAQLPFRTCRLAYSVNVLLRTLPHVQPQRQQLPPERTSDVRVARCNAWRSLEQSAHLGPGAYAPPTSVGGARPRTYRVFVDPFAVPQPTDRFGDAQADAAAIVQAHARSTSASMPVLGAASSANPTWGRAHTAGAVPTTAGGGGTDRSHHSGSLTVRSTVSAGSLSALRGGGRPAAHLAASAAFTGPFRSQMTGAYSPRMDSSLVRRR